MQSLAPQRSWAIYVVSGILLLLTLTFGSFFVVWCGTFSFLFQGDSPISILLLVFAGLIAWRSFLALRLAWQSLPEAPIQAMGALAILLIFVLVVDGYALSSGEMRGWFNGGAINWGLLAVPIVLILAAMALVYWLSPHFQGHLIDTDTVITSESFGRESNEDDDWMHLGGA